jgi:hypothetical protein
VSVRHITDQLAHFAAAALILSIFALGTVWAGALAGLALGLVRETAEAGGSRITLAEVAAHFRKRDPWIDLTFWALGGISASLIFN